jgi:hypothetical protein
LAAHNESDSLSKLAFSYGGRAAINAVEWSCFGHNIRQKTTKSDDRKLKMDDTLCEDIIVFVRIITTLDGDPSQIQEIFQIMGISRSYENSVDTMLSIDIVWIR